ncbi:MAG TPA: hypothetical protein V6D37_05075 [Candidatus Sericytochromatia bacterium]
MTGSPSQVVLGDFRHEVSFATSREVWGCIEESRESHHSASSGFFAI